MNEVGDVVGAEKVDVVHRAQGAQVERAGHSAVSATTTTTGSTGGSSGTGTSTGDQRDRFENEMHRCTHCLHDFWGKIVETDHYELVASWWSVRVSSR